MILGYIRASRVEYHRQLRCDKVCINAIQLDGHMRHTIRHLNTLQDLLSQMTLQLTIIDCVELIGTELCAFLVLDGTINPSHMKVHGDGGRIIEATARDVGGP